MLQTRINILRNKFFFLIGIIIFLSIFFITINNLQSHESELLQKIEKLELQNDAVSKQVEAEKEQQQQRLSAERQLYEKTKKELNQKLREQKEIHDKENHEASLRFNSLQQQYKILTTKHNDLEQSCDDQKKSLSKDNDELKRKLDHVQAQLSKTQISKENDGTVWKIKYDNLLSEKEKLQKLVESNNKASDDADEHQQLLQLKYKNYELEQEIKELKQKSGNNNVAAQNHAPEVASKSIDKSFKEQIRVSEDIYKIPINIRNKSNVVKDASKQTNNVKGIINSVENFQILPQQIAESQNVLQQPALMNGKPSSSTTTTPTSILKKEGLTVAKGNSSATKSSKKLPKFVLPIPDIKNVENNEIPLKAPYKDDKKFNLDETLNKPQNEDINEQENGAHEINDNDFNIEEKNARNGFDNLDENLDKNAAVNNAAEEIDHKQQNDKKSLGNDEMDLEIINRPPNNGNVKDKLKIEIENDHGKEDEYPEEDLHIQEQQEDDLGDIGEYDDLKALKNQGVAERN